MTLNYKTVVAYSERADAMSLLQLTRQQTQANYILTSSNHQWRMQLYVYYERTEGGKIVIKEIAKQPLQIVCLFFK